MISSSLAPGREKATFSRMVPSKRNDSCKNRPRRGAVRVEANRAQVGAIDENSTFRGHVKAEISPMVVDLPEPETDQGGYGSRLGSE